MAIVTNQSNVLARNVRNNYQPEGKCDFFGAIAANKEHHDRIIATNHIISTNKQERHDRIIFPQRLFRMMQEIEERHTHLSHIISWHQSDLTFAIHNPTAFVSEVMPIYFRGQTKLSSFQRQLKNYGFQRCQGKNSGGMIYYHEKFAFRRDKPGLLDHVVLKCLKTKNRALSFSSLLQMTSMAPRLVASSTTTTTTTIKSCLPQESSRSRFHTVDITPLPLSHDNVGDNILDEVAAELLWGWRPKEVRGEDFGDDFDFQQDRLAGQQWDLAVESLESLEEALC